MLNQNKMHGLTRMNNEIIDLILLDYKLQYVFIIINDIPWKCDF